MTRVVFHIGAGKCGSSAIQQHLATHADELRSSGVLVPDEDAATDRPSAGQHIDFFELLREAEPTEARRLWREKIDHLLAVARSEGLSTILFSAENLSNPTGTARALNDIDADVRMVFYCRRQVDYLVSAWQQWYLKTYPSPNDFLDEQLGVIGNWDLAVSDWEKAFGQQNVQVRRYGREFLVGGDIVADFLQAARLEGGAPSTAQEPVNASYSDAMTAIAMRCRDQFDSMHDNEFYASLASLVGSSAWRGLPTTFPFTAADVDRIEAAYEPSNQSVARKYFPDLDGPLFGSISEAGIAPADPDELRKSTLEVLDAAIRGLASTDQFDPAQRADFADLFESLRTTT